MTKTPLMLLQEKTTKTNIFRREAQEKYNLRSPTRQGWYIKARLQGKSPTQAIHAARKIKNNVRNV